MRLVELATDFGGPDLACNDGDIALGLGEGYFQRARFVRQAQQISACGDGGDEVFVGLGA